MKALIAYFTMGGRTKKIAEAIGSALSDYEVNYFPIEITGKFIQKIKILDKFENNDFSTIENELESLDAENYDLILIGMPTYGDKPPKAFDEIVSSMKNLSEKEVVVFNTARMTGKKAIDYMKKRIEEMGAQVIDQSRFRKFFWIGTKNAIQFGRQINNRHA